MTTAVGSIDGDHLTVTISGPDYPDITLEFQRMAHTKKWPPPHAIGDLVRDLIARIEELHDKCEADGEGGA